MDERLGGAKIPSGVPNSLGHGGATLGYSAWGYHIPWEIWHGGATFPRKFGMGVPNLGGGGGVPNPL